jgi:RNA polymerase sigma factor (sigma-70 family)
MQESVTERLKEVNWDDILPRLLLYTASLIRSYRLQEDISAEDIVQSSIADLFSGRRTLPTNLPLSTALMGIARSKISHVVERSKRMVPLEEDSLIEPERVTSNIEAKELQEKIRYLLRDDKLLARMVELIYEEPDLRSSELADRLGVSIEEVYHLKKRLKRKLRSNL